MNEIPLLGPHTYNDVDRAFWREHLKDWIPESIIDAHVHIADPALQIETITDEIRRSYWVMELSDMQDFKTYDHCYRTVFPGRTVSSIAFGMPNLGWDIESVNAYVAEGARQRDSFSLAVVRPTWVAEQVRDLLRRPGVIGVKPYYSLIGYDRHGRDKHIEASIYEFLPHHQLRVLDEYHAWVTLHVPRAGRLAHPDNLREVREIRQRYPRIKLVIAHLGRSYTLPHAREGLLPLAGDEGLFFDISAVLNPEVLELALEHLGPQRLLYGTDNPVFYMRGRRQWSGTTYRNRTSQPFYFNTEREPPEIEAGYTLYMYEALRALRRAVEKTGLDRDAIEDIFHRNAERLIRAR